MVEFFIWISKLTISELISFISVIVGLMLFIPYSKRFWSNIKTIFKGKKLTIIDFDFKLIPDIKLSETTQNELYYISKKGPLILGSKILLVWNIEGASRIDIAGIGKKLKGNTAVVILKDNFIFELIAYSWFGLVKKSTKLDLTKYPVLKLKTYPLNTLIPESQFNHQTKKLNLFSKKTESKIKLFNFRFFLKTINQLTNFEFKRKNGQDLGRYYELSSFKIGFNFSLKKYNKITKK